MRIILSLLCVLFTGCTPGFEHYVQECRQDHGELVYGSVERCAAVRKERGDAKIAQERKEALQQQGEIIRQDQLRWQQPRAGTTCYHVGSSVQCY